MSSKRESERATKRAEKAAKKRAEEEELEDDFDEAISNIAEFSEESEEEEEELYLDDDAEEKLEEYLEGAPAIIARRGDAQPQVSEDYPTENHAYCRVKASKTHREVAPEFNNTLIIREKK